MSTALVLLSDWQASQIEFWRPAPDLAGYDVSALGRIRSYWLQIANPGQGKGFRTVLQSTPALLNPSLDSSGYPYLNARQNQNARSRSCPKVHRLVALAFLPNPEKLPEVNHKTGIKADARLDNLEWTTRLGNMQHANRTGIRDVRLRGQLNPNVKLDEGDVRSIRNRALLGESCFSIAKDYAVNRCTIQDVVARRTWAHI